MKRIHTVLNCGPRLRLRLRAPACALASVAAVVVVSVSGCRVAEKAEAFLSEQVEITVALPGRPERWSAVAAPVYGVLDTEDGELNELPADARLTFTVPKERWVLFQARLCIAANGPSEAGRPFCTEPYGAVYRSNGADHRELRLRARDGAAVGLLRRLRRAGLKLEGFNVKRFLEGYREVAGPRGWAVDRTAIVEALQAGSFRITAIRLRDTLPVELVLPPGRWLSDRPGLRLDPQPGRDGGRGGVRVSMPQGDEAGGEDNSGGGLPAGTYRFFQPESARVYRVGISSEGAVVTGR